MSAGAMQELYTPKPAPAAETWTDHLELQARLLVRLRAADPARFADVRERDLIGIRARYGNPALTIAMQALVERLEAGGA